MASKRDHNYNEISDMEGATTPDIGSLANLIPTNLKEQIARKNKTDTPQKQEETVENVRGHLRPVTDIPEPNPDTGAGGDQPAKAVATVDEQAQEPAKETEELSFETAMESAKTVDDKKLLEEMSKQYSGKKLIVRKPVQGVGWEAQPRKEDEGPLTVEQSQQLCNELNASLKRLTPAKPEAEPSSVEELASLIAVIEDIGNPEKLKAFAEKCAQTSSPLLHGGATERGFWVKPIKGSEISKKLVDAINKRSSELVVEGFLNDIEEATDSHRLETLAFSMHKRKLITKTPAGRDWKVEAIEGVEGSKKLVKAIIKRRGELFTFKDQMEAIEGKQNGPELEKTAQKLHYAGYVIKTGIGKAFKVVAGKKYGGKELAEAIMAKKGTFIDQGLKTPMGEMLAEHIGKK